MSNTNKSYRIKTSIAPERDSAIFIDTSILQEYDTFDILSLKIDSVDTYKLHNAKYGVVVGRVLANNGFGVPNAKISIFVEADSEAGRELNEIYPYTNTASKNKDGVRYNLLPDDKVNDCHKVVGTFPNKRYALDNDVILEVFDKYYKYTTRTNNSGDYLLMGVPVGLHTLHMDLDLSDCGVLSQRPRDFVYKGYNIEHFENPNQFKGGTSYDTLSHIFTQDQIITVAPFWGNGDNGENIGITRADIDVAFKFEPTCVFIGSVISDHSSEGISKRCIPSEKMGSMEELTTGEGTIEMIRKTPSGAIEEFQVKGTQLIDGNGTWCYQIPMNLDYMMTDEYGNMVPTDDPAKGIPTRTQVRFRISMQDTEENIDNYFRAKVLVPHNPQATENGGESYDYEFGSLTRDSSFRDLFWNNVYTIKSYIPRFQKKKVGGWKTKKFTGIKGCNFFGNNNPLPYNNMRIELPFIFVALCALIKAFVVVVKFVNFIISVLGKLFCQIASIGILSDKLQSSAFNRAKDLSLVTIGEGLCPDLENWYFAPITSTNYLSETKVDGYGKYNILKQTIASVESVSEGGNAVGDTTSIDAANKDESDYAMCITTSTDYLISCIELNLAMEHKVINFDFYNDWINGTIYIPRFMRYVRPKRTFLGKTIIKSKVKGCMDDTTVFSNTRRYTQQCAIKYEELTTTSNGNNIYTYTSAEKPIVKNDKTFNSKHKKSGLSQCTIFGANGGICHEQTTIKNQHVYYLKPCEWINRESLQKKVNLFATDLVLLGSLNECDMNGLPQPFKYLAGTSYILPTNLALTNMETDGYLYTNSNGSVCIGGSSSSTDVTSDRGNNVRVAKTGLVAELMAYSGTSENYDVQYDGDELSDVIALTESAGIAWNYTGPGQGDNIPHKLYYPGGHFLGLSCVNAQSNLKSCLNLSRICEVGVNMSQRREDIRSINDEGKASYAYIVPSGFISGDDITSHDFRAMFATLNKKRLVATKLNATNGYKTYEFEFIKPINFNGEFKKTLTDVYNESKSRYVPIENAGTLTKLGINTDFTKRLDYDEKEASNTRTKTKEILSYDYYLFRMGLSYDSILNARNSEQRRKFLLKDGNDYYLPQYENSYYFYFGLKNGATAIDEFNKQFFATCDSSKLVLGAPTLDITVKNINMCDITADLTVSVTNLTTPYNAIMLKSGNDTSFTIIPQKDNPDMYNNYMFTIEGIKLGKCMITIQDAEGVEITKEIDLNMGISSFDVDTFDYNSTDGSRQKGGLIEQGGYMKISNIFLDHLASGESLTLIVVGENGDKNIIENVFVNGEKNTTLVEASGSGVYRFYVKYDCYYKNSDPNDNGYEIGYTTIHDNSDIKIYIGDINDDKYRVYLNNTEHTSNDWWKNIKIDGTNYNNWLIRRNLSNYLKKDERGSFKTCSSNVHVENGRKVLWGLSQNALGINMDTVYCTINGDVEIGWDLDDEHSYWPTYKYAYGLAKIEEITHYSVLGINGKRVSGAYEKWIGCEDMTSSVLKDGYGYVFKPLPDGDLQYGIYDSKKGYVYDDMEGSITHGVFYPSVVFPMYDRPFSEDYSFYVWQEPALVPTIGSGLSIYSYEKKDVEKAGRVEFTLYNGITYNTRFHPESYILGYEDADGYKIIGYLDEYIKPNFPPVGPLPDNPGGTEPDLPTDDPIPDPNPGIDTPIIEPDKDIILGAILNPDDPSIDEEKHDLYGLDKNFSISIGSTEGYQSRKLLFNGFVNGDVALAESGITSFEYAIFDGSPESSDTSRSRVVSGKTNFSFHESIAYAKNDDGSYSVVGIGGNNPVVNECFLCLQSKHDTILGGGLIIPSEEKYVYTAKGTQIHVECTDKAKRENFIITIWYSVNKDSATCTYVINGERKQVSVDLEPSDGEISIIEKIIEKCGDIVPVKKYTVNPNIDNWKEKIKNDKNYFNSQTILMGTLYAVEVIIDTENYKGNWYDEDKVIFKIFPNISEIIDDTNIDEEIPEVDSDGDNSADGEENV